MQKPVRLELNNSGSWKVLGRFDAADETQADLVLDTAEKLIQTLHNGGPSRQCPTLRVSGAFTGDTTTDVLMRWDIENGWRDAATGEPA